MAAARGHKATNVTGQNEVDQEEVVAFEKGGAGKKQ
jgi:hypothetical protein